MLLSSAFLQLSFFVESPLAYDFGLGVVSSVDKAEDSVAFEEALEAFKASYADAETPLIQLIVDEEVLLETEDLSSLRSQEKEVVFYEARPDEFNIAVYDKRDHV